jgi:HipA-like protein
LEQIWRMRGGAQSHLMRCSDGNYFVVKFQNNLQHRRILVNELLGTRLASWLGLPTAPVEVGAELIRLAPELCIELPRSRTTCAAGLQFGSRYPGDPRQMTLHDFLPDEKLREVENLYDFAGMLALTSGRAIPTAGRRFSLRARREREGGRRQRTEVERDKRVLHVERNGGVRNWTLAASEFTAVTDVHLIAKNERHQFVRETLRDAGVETVPLEALAVWTAKMRPMIQ